MKMADLPSRVVRPLGDWDDADTAVSTQGLTPLQSRILALVAQGVSTAPEIVQRTGASAQGVCNVLRGLERQGRVKAVEPLTPPMRSGRRASEWVAL